MGDLRVRAVTAGYGRDAVLDSVDLTVAEGTVTAVLGRSGSGKTTLLRTIAGFMRPLSGEVVVGGRTLAGPGTWVPPHRRGIGYVRQDGGLFPHLSVAGNIGFGLPWPRRRHRARVQELLELVDLPASVIDRSPEQLSGGQQQRVALARALAPRPALILLDEPFSSLDTSLRAATRAATARALEAIGATAVLVTHDQGEALSFADEVAVLSAGRFRQTGRPREVYGRPVDVEVARALGEAVVLDGTAWGGRAECVLGPLVVDGAVPEGAIRAVIRPEQILLSAPEPGLPTATVGAVEYFGHGAVLELFPDDAPGQGAGPEGSGGEPEGIRSRVVGLQPPRTGDRVGVRVVGPVRVVPHAGDGSGAPGGNAIRTGAVSP
ncbi:ABC transporter ATP-binding protein [Citricoccus nitrophenolicus]|uniref:ABC transporter ATP-binding protein n=1 Tax=Citricoccus nitrophenolicus TaxID=863575 RepID=UPI0031EFF0A1